MKKLLNYMSNSKIFLLNRANTIAGIFVAYSAKTREWDWYMCSVKVLLRDNESKPILLITVAMQIDPQSYFTAKAAQMLEENEFLKNIIMNLLS